MSKRIMIGLLVVSLMFNVGFIAYGGMRYLKSREVRAAKEFSPYYLGQKSLFESLPNRIGEIVFLGDSITERNRWDELFGNDRIINRGIGSDTTRGVLNRISEVTVSKPEKIFLMVGINDLSLGFKRDETLKNYNDIIKTIKAQSPETKIYIQSVLPVNNKKYGNKINNQDVIEINEELKKIAEANDLTYIDLFSALASDGQLRDDYTLDGIHLTGEAYQVWKEVIMQYVNE